MPVGLSETMVTAHFNPFIKHFRSIFCVREMIIEVKHGIIHIDILRCSKSIPISHFHPDFNIDSPPLVAMHRSLKPNQDVVSVKYIVCLSGQDMK